MSQTCFTTLYYFYYYFVKYLSYQLFHSKVIMFTILFFSHLHMKHSDAQTFLFIYRNIN